MLGCTIRDTSKFCQCSLRLGIHASVVFPVISVKLCVLLFLLIVKLAFDLTAVSSSDLQPARKLPGLPSLNENTVNAARSGYQSRSKHPVKDGGPYHFESGGGAAGRVA